MIWQQEKQLVQRGIFSEKKYEFSFKFGELIKRSISLSVSGSDMVFLYYPQRLPMSQCHPFYYYKQKIKKQFGIKINFLNILKLKFYKQEVSKDTRYVCIQTWFDIDKANATHLIENIEKVFPNAKIIYFDWFAPTDLRAASIFGDKVAKYVKKNLLKNYNDYLKPTKGDTNLNEFYSSLFGIEQPQTINKLPSSFQEKLVLGPNFNMSPFLLKQVKHVTKNVCHKDKNIDISARLGGAHAKNWYGEMRKLALAKVDLLPSEYSVGKTGNLKFSQYYEELLNSKITFSPFGYGEVCWRDYEAILTGSLLVKPNMKHILVEPNIFIEGETYAPLSWDFSNFNQVVEKYLDNRSERIRISENALNVLWEYVENEDFLKFFERIL